MQLIILNMIPTGTFPICYISQGDIKRDICLAIMDGDNPFIFDGTEELIVNVRRPDGEVIEKEIENTSSSIVTFVTSDEMSEISGKCVCNLRIESGETSVSSLNFIMEVEGL